MYSEIQDHQANFINKASNKILCEIYNKEIQGKLGLLLYSRDPFAMEQIKRIEEIAKIIDRQIREGNNRRALLFTCLLKKKVAELVDATKNTDINL